MKPITYRSVLMLAVAGLVLAVVPNAASARQASVPVAARAQTSPTFVFPSSGQTFPLNGSMLFQVQPVSGAQGYLWSFVQNGAVVWQNLAWDGRLGGATYNVGKGSQAESHMHGGNMQVWVRAWMGGNQWSGLSTLGVRLQGAASGPAQPQLMQPTHPAPGTVLYQADTSGGFDKWTTTKGWKYLNGMLLNDGTNGSSVISPPYNPAGISDYAVEAQIQTVQKLCDSSNLGTGADFGIRVRGASDGTTGYALDIQSENSPQCPIHARLLVGKDTIATQQNISTDTDWHIYRVEVKGNTVKGLVDGAVVFTVTDNRYLTGGGITLYDGSYFTDTGAVAQLQVRSFKVIAL